MPHLNQINFNQHKTAIRRAFFKKQIIIFTWPPALTTSSECYNAHLKRRKKKQLQKISRIFHRLRVNAMMLKNKMG